MNNNILASIALFGIYRNKNQDTYDLVAQYISAVIAQKEYESFDAATIQADLKELFQIEIPIGVINSVCKNRIDGLSLSKGVFSCSRIPKDEIEKEYSDLSAEYDELFERLIAFVKREAEDFDSQIIKDGFAEYLVEGSTSETKLNNLFAAFIASNQNEAEVRQKIDLLSSGLISYNGLSYTDSAGNSGAWTERLTIYLDTEFLFSCAGYNDAYPREVFQELYDLIAEINRSYQRRTKKKDNLVELKYFKDTRDLYLALLNSAKSYVEGKGVPDPSKRALMKIIRESDNVFDVNTHQAIIDSAVMDTFHIKYDDTDYGNYILDRRYVIYDEQTDAEIARVFNPTKDETIKRKIDYYSRVYTIINGLRGGRSIRVFEECRYIFLTGSRIGRGTSMAARSNRQSVALATDIDFLVSRFWFKLNKQLVNNNIPVSLDIVARSQAALTREVSRKVKTLYEELKQKNLSKSEQESLYANLTAAERYLAPNSQASTDDVLTFIDYENVDDLIKNQQELKRKVEEAEKNEKELLETKGKLAEKEEELAGLKQSINDKTEAHKKKLEDAEEKGIKQGRIIKWLILGICLLFVLFVIALVF